MVQISADADKSDYIQAARFVAALLVVITHATFYANDRLDGLFKVWHFGEVGVPIFFVISGLVMVLSSRSLPADLSGSKQFLIRRFVRIVPLYWVVTLFKIVVAIAVPAAVNHNHFQIDHAVKSLLFIPYFNGSGEVRPMHGVGWTLLHEVFFYILFSVSMLFGRWRNIVVVGVIVALWFFGSGVSDKSAYEVVITSSMNMYFVLGLGLGVSLDIFMVGRGTLFLGFSFLASAILVSIMSKQNFLPTVLIFSGAMLLLYRHRLRSFRIIVELGNSSYSLYLFHPIIAPAVVVMTGKYLGLHIWGAIFVSIAVSIVISHALHVFIEKPVVRYAKVRLSN